MATTRWKDAKLKKIDDALNRFTSDLESKGNNLNGQTEYTNFDVKKIFEDNIAITLNEKQLLFNLIKYSFDTIVPGQEDVVDRTNRNEGFVIVYFDGININYIINRNSDAMRILRMLANYIEKKTIVENNVGITSDMFIWMVSKVYGSQNYFPLNSSSDETDDEKALVLNDIIGFKGNTMDLLNTVSADGGSVMNILSTLSFMLESKVLNQIKVRLEYPKHENIEIRLTVSGTINTSTKTYSGIFEENSTDDLIMSKLFLLLYIEVIPRIKQFYQLDLDNGDWGSSKYADFLDNVANDLKNKVDKKLSVINAPSH